MTDPILLETLLALGALVLGGGTVKGYDRFRRRNRNGLSDGDKIVAALKDEGRKARELTHECHDDLVKLYGAIKTDTEVLRDRGPG